MSKVYIQLNSKGISELMKSDEIADFLQSKADDMIARCSKGSYVSDTQIHHRAVTRVSTADRATYYRNLHSNELLKAMGGSK